MPRRPPSVMALEYALLGSGVRREAAVDGRDYAGRPPRIHATYEEQGPGQSVAAAGGASHAAGCWPPPAASGHLCKVLGVGG